MIFAMHQTKVACLVRHGRGSAYMEALMRRIASEQLLMASSTTEGQNGGNIRASAAAVAKDGDEINLLRDATVISYGAEADGLVTIARRADNAAASDQVLLALTKDDYSLKRTLGWETLGMRGTCSTGFELKVQCPADRVFAESYDRIHGQTMTPFAHLTLVVGLGRHRRRGGRSAPSASFARPRAVAAASCRRPPRISLRRRCRSPSCAR